jgi:hypothetical protein
LLTANVASSASLIKITDNHIIDNYPKIHPFEGKEIPLIASLMSDECINELPPEVRGGIGMFGLEEKCIEDEAIEKLDDLYSSSSLSTLQPSTLTLFSSTDQSLSSSSPLLSSSLSYVLNEPTRFIYKHVGHTCTKLLNRYILVLGGKEK